MDHFKKEEQLVENMKVLLDQNADCKNLYDCIIKGSWSQKNTRISEIKQFLRQYPTHTDFVCGIFLHYRNTISNRSPKPTPKYLASLLLEYGADPDICLWGKDCTLFHDFVIDAHSDMDSEQRVDIRFILELGPSTDNISIWGNSVLHITAMMLCQQKHRVNPVVQQNFIDLVDYGYNPLLKDQYFCQGHNSLTCLYRSSPELYSRFRDYVSTQGERLDEIQKILNKLEYVRLPEGMAKCIVDFTVRRFLPIDD